MQNIFMGRTTESQRNCHIKPEILFNKMHAMLSTTAILLNSGNLGAGEFVHYSEVETHKYIAVGD